MDKLCVPPKFSLRKIRLEARFWGLRHLSAWKDDNGFVLIEVAIAMIVFGLLLGPGFVAWRTHNTLRKHRITLHHQKLVFQALAQYLEHNGGLPFPSPLSSPVWGESIRPADLSTPLKPGLVPYRTLGLPMRVAKDGFGNWMTYVVDIHLTHRNLQYQNQLCQQFFTKPSALDVLEAGKSVHAGMTENGQLFTPLTYLDGKQKVGNRFNGIAVILVSHGSTGWGAPIAPGQRLSFPATAYQDVRMNGDDGLVFCAPHQTAGTQPINHVVVAWKTRSQMVSDAHLVCMDSFFLKTPPSSSGLPSGSHSTNAINPKTPIPANPTSNATGFTPQGQFARPPSTLSYPSTVPRR